MARIMNMDRCMNPRPVSIIAEVELERGMFVEIKGMAANNIWLAGEDDFEAYQVALAVKVGRGHYVTVGDEITIAADLINGEVEVGNELTLAADGKLTTGAGLAKVVKVYNWTGQDSVMIRFI